MISLNNISGLNNIYSSFKVDSYQNKNYNSNSVTLPKALFEDRFEKSNISFEGKMDREEAQKDRIAFIFSNLDFEKISDQLVKYGEANTGGEMINLFSNYNSKPIHICYLTSSDGGDFSHYYCEKEDFVDIIERTKKIISEESPEYLEIFNKSAEVIYNKLKKI